MAQLAGYELDRTLSFPGDTADMSARVVDSYAAQGVIEFGEGVQEGTDPAKQVAPFAGGTFVGVAKYSHAEETGQYEDEGTVAVVTFGRVIVDTLAVDVTAGETAYVVDASGVWTNASADATEAGKFLTSGEGRNVVDLGKA